VRARIGTGEPANHRRTGAVAVLFSFALIGSVFWIAQMLQVGMGYSPLASGVRMLVLSVADSGVAAGSNNTLRETGGLFGVAA
jgi:hypothetical protein